MLYNANDSPDHEMDSISHRFDNTNTEPLSDQEYEEIQDEFHEIAE